MAHSHAAADGRTSRHDHEAEVYDARALALLASLTDDELMVSADVPPFPNREHVDFLSYALAELGDPRGKRILEIGSGSGALAVYLAHRGAEVVALDVSDGNCQLARRRAQVNGVADRVTFLSTPVEVFEAPAGSFDAAIGNQVLHHVDLPVAMPRINELLSEDGVAVFCEPVLLLPEVFRTVRNSRATTSVFPSRADTPDERSISVADLDVIAGAFGTCEWRPFQVLCRLQNFFELSDRMFARLEAIDRWLLRRPRLTRWACRYGVVVARSRPRPSLVTG